MISSVNKLNVLLSLVAVAAAVGPSIEIYNTNNVSNATFSIRTIQSIPSLKNINQLDLTLYMRKFCYTGV